MTNDNNTPKFNIRTNTNVINITLDHETATKLASVLHVHSIEQGLPSTIFALGEQLSRTTNPEKWFGPDRRKAS
jgi:hypothetical protein